MSGTRCSSSWTGERIFWVESGGKPMLRLRIFSSYGTASTQLANLVWLVAALSLAAQLAEPSSSPLSVLANTGMGDHFFFVLGIAHPLLIISLQLHFPKAATLPGTSAFFSAFSHTKAVLSPGYVFLIGPLSPVFMLLNGYEE